MNNVDEQCGPRSSAAMADGTVSIQKEISIPNSIRFILAVILVGAGFYCLTIAFYSASMSALEAYAPAFGTLEARFWSFVTLAFVLIAAGSMLFVVTIKKINRKDRQINS